MDKIRNILYELLIANLLILHPIAFNKRVGNNHGRSQINAMGWKKKKKNQISLYRSLKVSSHIIRECLSQTCVNALSVILCNLWRNFCRWFIKLFFQMNTIRRITILSRNSKTLKNNIVYACLRRGIFANM